MKRTSDRYRSGSEWGVRVIGLVAAVMFVVLSIFSVARGQTDDGQSGETGVVTGDQVRLRGGPGTNYKQVGMVNQGKTLRIKRKQGKWFEVVPPEEASVWIYGEYVEEIDSTTGKVTGTDVNVRPLPRADQTNMPVGQVSKPAKVVIRETKSREGEDFSWYRIKMPEGLSPWVHSKFIDTGSSEGAESTGEPDQPDQPSDDESESSQKGETAQNGGTPQKGTPQKGGGAQKGGVQKGGDGTTGGSIGAQGAPQKWVDRLEGIQEEVRTEREKENKLRWDFSDQIDQLDSYIQNCPDDRLVSQATELRDSLKDVQSNVQKQRARLNQRLKEIKQERKDQVRNSIQDVLEAKGFTWDAVGYVRSVGGLYAMPPGEYELVKGNERVYFLTSGRDILKLQNYRGLQVAISGNEKPVQDNQWGVPLMEVQEIEVVR